MYREKNIKFAINILNHTKDFDFELVEKGHLIRRYENIQLDYYDEEIQENLHKILKKIGILNCEIYREFIVFALIENIIKKELKQNMLKLFDYKKREDNYNFIYKNNVYIAYIDNNNLFLDKKMFYS